MAKVRACGVEGVEISYDDLLQDDVATFPTESQWDEAKVACLAQVSFDTGYHFQLPEKYLAAFYHQRDVISRPWYIELARNQLDEMGKLDGLPIRGATLSDELFAKKLEEHCGPHAAGMLSSEFGPHAIAPLSPGSDFADYQRQGEAVLCLGSAGVVTGFEIGLIGNEKVAQ